MKKQINRSDRDLTSNQKFAKQVFRDHQRFTLSLVIVCLLTILIVLGIVFRNRVTMSFTTDGAQAQAEWEPSKE